MSIRFTEDEYEDYLKRQGKHNPLQAPVAEAEPKKQKYRNNRVNVDGILFDSQKEADRYSELKLLLKSGIIRGFCRQPEFILVEGNEVDKAIKYKADFIVFYPDGSAEIEDTKGYETQEWKRTYKMFRLKYPDLELKVIK